jgi:tripartite-type tricarboxylate transporter receptor subunit TctC
VLLLLLRVVTDAQRIPEAVRTMEADGYALETSTPEEFAAFINEQYTQWGKLIEEQGIRPTG